MGGRDHILPISRIWNDNDLAVSVFLIIKIALPKTTNGEC